MMNFTVGNLRKLFEKQVFIRLNEDRTAFMCTAKWLLLSRIRWVAVSGSRPNVVPQSRNLAPIVQEESRVYGSDTTRQEILDGEVKVPESARDLAAELGKYAARVKSADRR